MRIVTSFIFIGIIFVLQQILYERYWDAELKVYQDLIRHYYRKKLKSMLKNWIPMLVSQTPNKRANDKYTEHTDGLKELTSYYNKACYSKEIIRKEDVKQAKTYL